MAKTRKGFVTMSQTLDGKKVEKDFPAHTVDHWKTKGWRVVDDQTTTKAPAKTAAQTKES